MHGASSAASIGILEVVFKAPCVSAVQNKLCMNASKCAANHASKCAANHAARQWLRVDLLLQSLLCAAEVCSTSSIASADALESALEASCVSSMQNKLHRSMFKHGANCTAK